MTQQKVLILGITGMLGLALFKKLHASDRYHVSGAARTVRGLERFF